MNIKHNITRKHVVKAIALMLAGGTPKIYKSHVKILLSWMLHAEGESWLNRDPVIVNLDDFKVEAEQWTNKLYPELK